MCPQWTEEADGEGKTLKGVGGHKDTDLSYSVNLNTMETGTNLQSRSHFFSPSLLLWMCLVTAL